MVTVQCLILLFMCFECTPATEYYVTARSDSSDCPESFICRNLSFYTSSQEAYFVNNAFFHFLEGLHYLEHSIIVHGVSNLSLVGIAESIPGDHDVITETSSVITCLSSDGIGNIIFNNCSSNISFKYITIKNCSNISYLGNSDDDYRLTVFFHEVLDIFLDHVVVLGSGVGTGLFVWNGYGVQIESSCFAYNTVSVHTNYTAPNECSLYHENFDINLFTSNFSFSKIGVVIVLNPSLLYSVNTVLNSVVACKHLYANIVFIRYSECSHQLRITSSIFSHAYYGIQIFMYDEDDTSLDKSYCAGNVSFDTQPDIELFESQFLSNYQGITFFYRDFSVKRTIFVQLFGCFIGWNSDYGVYTNVDLPPQTYAVVFQMRNTSVYENGFSNPVDTAVIFFARLNVSLEDINISNNSLTGMFLEESIATINGSNIFYNNSGNTGGAIRLFQSLLTLGLRTSLYFINNYARKGSVFYVTGTCVFQVSENLLDKSQNNISLVFKGNMAEIPSDLYYEYLDFCRISLDNLDNVFNVTSDTRVTITTTAIGVCYCNNDLIKDSLAECYDGKVISMTKYPGETLEIPLTTVGSGGGNQYSLTDGTVVVSVDNKYSKEVAYNGTGCNNVSYNVRRSSLNVTSTQISFEVRRMRYQMLIISHHF